MASQTRQQLKALCLLVTGLSQSLEESHCGQGLSRSSNQKEENILYALYRSCHLRLRDTGAACFDVLHMLARQASYLQNRALSQSEEAHINAMPPSCACRVAAIAPVEVHLPLCDNFAVYATCALLLICHYCSACS